MGREVGGGIGMGKTCKLKDVSFQKIKNKIKKKNKIKNWFPILFFFFLIFDCAGSFLGHMGFC